MIVMQEVLSRRGENDKPLDQQEYWTLELHEVKDGYSGGFVVQQARARWSETYQRVLYDQVETDRLPLLAEAEVQYGCRWLALVKSGFSHSDMDF